MYTAYRLWYLGLVKWWPLASWENKAAVVMSSTRETKGIRTKSPLWRLTDMVSQVDQEIRSCIFIMSCRHRRAATMRKRNRFVPPKSVVIPRIGMAQRSHHEFASCSHCVHWLSYVSFAKSEVHAMEMVQTPCSTLESLLPVVLTRKPKWT